MSAPQGSAEKRILYLQYTNPGCYPPLGRSAHLLAEKGWQVLFLGVGSVGGETLQILPHPNITVRTQTFITSGLKQKLHYLTFFLWVFSWIIRWRPQWIYASDALSTPLALPLSYLSRIRILYHEHDSPGETMANTLWTRLVLRCRRRLVRRANLCVLPNAERAKYFSEKTGCRRVISVWNCPVRSEISAPRPSPSLEMVLPVIYCGSIGAGRLPLTLLHAMAQLPKTVTLCVVGYETIGSQGYLRQFQEMAKQLGIDGRIRYEGESSRREKLFELLDSCRIGLCLVPLKSLDVNEKRMVGASNKPFEYMARGLVPLVPESPDWRRIYVEPGYGLACDPGDPESIAIALRWCLGHPAQVHAMGEKGRQRILQEWNYEKQFFPVFGQLNGYSG